MSILEFSNTDYDWKSISLIDFINDGHYPSLWDDFFSSSSVRKILHNISDELEEEKGKIYPPVSDVFKAFYLLKLEDIKVVILGQDPYHNGSAVGLCFSVKHGNYINPSLKNIYTELKLEGYSPNENGNLFHWARQGCLMLNTALTVKQSVPDSHTDFWYPFSIELIKYISANRTNVVWILMGAKAFAFSKYINNKHSFLVSSHPSSYSYRTPFRQYPSFLGSDLFKKANKILREKGEKEIIW